MVNFRAISSRWAVTGLASVSGAAHIVFELWDGLQIARKEKDNMWDSNTITPGTPFMHRVSVALQFYIHQRLNNDPGWMNITVRTPAQAVPTDIAAYSLSCLLRLSLVQLHPGR